MSSLLTEAKRILNHVDLDPMACTVNDCRKYRDVAKASAHVDLRDEPCSQCKQQVCPKECRIICCLYQSVPRGLNLVLDRFYELGPFGAWDACCTLFCTLQQEKLLVFLDDDFYFFSGKCLST